MSFLAFLLLGLIAGAIAKLILPGKQGGGWYPQVIGIEGAETDKLAGHVARLFISGRSFWEIVFHRTDNQEEENLPIPPRPAPRGRGEPIIR